MTPDTRERVRFVGMRRILVTGMSRTGKSTALVELEKRGFDVVDTDEDGWSLWSDAEGRYVWDEDRIATLLECDEGRVLYVSGTVSNEGGSTRASMPSSCSTLPPTCFFAGSPRGRRTSMARAVENAIDLASPCAAGRDGRRRRGVTSGRDSPGQCGMTPDASGAKSV